MAQHLVGYCGNAQALGRNSSIGCVLVALATQGLSACFGPALARFWANTCAFWPKSPAPFAFSLTPSQGRLGWANRKAAWSISHLTGNPHRHTGEAVCSLPPSVSSVWSAMRLSKQHSFLHLQATRVHLSRNWHPPKHDVPHTPPREGKRSPALALLGVGSQEVAPC